MLIIFSTFSSLKNKINNIYILNFLKIMYLKNLIGPARPGSGDLYIIQFESEATNQRRWAKPILVRVWPVP